MPEALTTSDDAIERLVTMFRERLESAVRNGQRIRMDQRDRARSRPLPMHFAANAPLDQLLSACEPDGSWEFHVYIEPKRAEHGLQNNPAKAIDV